MIRDEPTGGWSSSTIKSKQTYITSKRNVDKRLSKGSNFKIALTLTGEIHINNILPNK